MRLRVAVAGAVLALALVGCSSDGSDGASAPEASTDPAELVGVVSVLDEATREPWRRRLPRHPTSRSSSRTTGR